MSLTSKFCCCFPLLQILRCAVILSSIRISNTDIVNWELLDTYCKYLNNAWLLSGFKVGVGNSYISIGNMISLPTAATLRITSVSSIGALFHVYWYVFSFRINESWLPLYCPEIACVLFRNRWYFSMLFPYDCRVLHAIILFEGTYTSLQRRLQISCLHPLLTLLTWQMTTQILP